MSVQRRQVFYVSGFDHRGAQHYHALYRHHATQQAQRHGYQMQVSDAVQDSPYSVTWQVDYQHNGQHCHTQYTYLVLDDLIRAGMQQSGALLWWHAAQSFARYVRSGVLKHSLQQAKSFGLTLLAVYLTVLILPLLLLLALLLLLLGQGWALAALLALAGLGWWINRKINAIWLLHAYNFNVRYADDHTLLQARLDQLAQYVAHAVQSRAFDEVLLVGHCYGSALLPCLLRSASQQLNQPLALSVLTLAQTTPALSGLSAWYRADLADADWSQVDWVDFSSPADGVCYPQVDVLAGLGLRGLPRRLLKSPRFFKLFAAEEYRRMIRKNKFRVHFQYLLSSHFNDEYDYFQLTAGVQRLAERYWPRAEQGQ